MRKTVFLIFVSMISLTQYAVSNFATQAPWIGQEQAKNVLRFFYGYKYSLPSVDSYEERKSNISNKYSQKPINESFVIVFLNPATNHVIFEWKPSEQFSPSRISLYDIYGKGIVDFQISNKAGSFICDVQKFERGAYIYKMTDKNGNLIYSGKIILK